MQPPNVMPGLVPGIPAVPTAPSFENSYSGTAWMAGTSPGHHEQQLRVFQIFSRRERASISPDSPTQTGEGVTDYAFEQ